MKERNNTPVGIFDRGEGAHRDVYQDIGRNKSLLFTKTLEMTLTLFSDCYLSSKNYVCLWCSVLVVVNLNSSGQSGSTTSSCYEYILIDIRNDTYLFSKYSI